jgi:chromosome partitioning protein
MTTVALYSNKGGVGKTAATVNLAYLAAQAGRTTLVCDLDPQASSTFYFRIKPKLKKKAQGLAKNNSALDASIKGSDFPNLDLLPADFTHRKLDIGFSKRKRSRTRLAETLAPLQDEYDLLLLDCPPTINLLAENVFQASDFLLTPLVPTTLSLRTYDQLREFLIDAGEAPDRLYLFLSMVDRRKKLHRATVDEVKQKFAGVLPSTIPYSSTIEQMGLHRQPVPVFAPRSPATEAYASLWRDIEAHLLTQ